MAEIALKGEHLTFRYFENGKKNILEDVSIAFPKGRISVLMGSGGSGKSTLLNVLAGLYPENGGFLVDGKVELLGNDISGMSVKERGRSLSVMFQNPDLQFCMNTLRKEMTFCLENIETPPEEMEQRILEAAEWFSMENMLDQPVHTLSGGEKQKAILSCIYMMKTGVILLDEPFANLDYVWAGRITALLRKMNREIGTTIIAVDHALDYWADTADELFILEQGGKVHADILVAEIPEFRAVFDAEGLRFPREVRRRALTSAGEGKPAVTLSHVTVAARQKRSFKAALKKQPQRMLLEDVSAVIPRGKMTALYGPAGSGKTTLFLAMIRQQAFSGDITMFGMPVAKTKEKTLFQTAGIVFQNPSHQFVTQNVLSEVMAGMETPDEEKALQLLDEFGLKGKKKLSPYMLSQGQQRRLAVISVLTQGERLLILDEPTYGQDDAMTEAIMQMLSRRVREEGLTVLFTSHDRRLIAEWADDCWMLKERKLMKIRPENVFSENFVVSNASAESSERLASREKSCDAGKEDKP